MCSCSHSIFKFLVPLAAPADSESLMAHRVPAVGTRRPLCSCSWLTAFFQVESRCTSLAVLSLSTKLVETSFVPYRNASGSSAAGRGRGLGWPGAPTRGSVSDNSHDAYDGCHGSETSSSFAPPGRAPSQAGGRAPGGPGDSGLGRLAQVVTFTVTRTDIASDRQ